MAVPLPVAADSPGAGGAATAEAKRPAVSVAVWAAVVGATLAALALRAAFVGDQSLGYEEVFTAGIAGQPSLDRVWDAVKATESTPPLYYALTWASVRLAGSHTAAALRTVSLLAGTAAVPASFLATSRFLPSRLAAAAACLCAVSPMLVGYSIYARSYALLVLVATLSVAALGAALARPTWPRLALWGLAGAACLWTHYFAAFLVAGEAVVLMVRLPRQARAALLLCLAGVAAAAAPLGAVFLAQSSDAGRTAFIAARPLGGRLADVVRQFAIGTNVPSAWLEAAGILLAAGAALYAGVRTRGRPQTRILGTLVLIGGGLPVLGAVAGIGDHLLPRNIAAVWICVAALAAHGLSRLRAVPLVAYGAICLAAVVTAQSDWRYQAATDWRGASARIGAAARGVPIAVMPGVQIGVAGLYLNRRALAAPIEAADLWAIIEPRRGAGQRALGPVADPPLAQLWGPGLRPVGEVDYRGFRMIHLRSAQPTRLTPAPGADGPPTAPLALLLAP